MAFGQVGRWTIRPGALPLLFYTSFEATASPQRLASVAGPFTGLSRRRPKAKVGSRPGVLRRGAGCNTMLILVLACFQHACRGRGAGRVAREQAVHVTPGGPELIP